MPTIGRTRGVRASAQWRVRLARAPLDLEITLVIRIRMQRLGRTHRPFYRIGAIDARERRNGKMLENLGWFNPMERDEAKQLSLKTERIEHWLSVGAKPSDTVRDILGKQELLPEKMRAEWEAERQVDRDRLACKQHAPKVEEALNELNALSESAEADISEFIAQAKAARTRLKRSISRGKIEWAEQAVAEAEKALADAKGAQAAARGRGRRRVGFCRGLRRAEG